MMTIDSIDRMVEDIDEILGNMQGVLDAGVDDPPELDQILPPIDAEIEAKMGRYAELRRLLLVIRDELTGDANDDDDDEQGGAR